MSQIFDQESICLQASESPELMDIVKESEDTFDKLFPAGSFRRLLWEQQKKVFGAKDRRQMRWHPALIRWAISVHPKTSSAYKLIRESGYLILPHLNTLYNYTLFTQPEAGINAQLLWQMYNEWRIGEMKT